MTRTESVTEKLRTTFVPFTDVWFYSPNEDRKDWDGQYERVDGETRPVDRNASFDLRLISDNTLSLTPESAGIYVIRDELSVIYIGLTDRNIKQRFDAHVSKLTAVNKWHHPVRWQKYVIERSKRNGQAFERLDDFQIGFYDLRDFQSNLQGTTDKEHVHDMEALMFYGLCVTNPKERFLNTESSVGSRASREKWKGFFGR